MSAYYLFSGVFTVSYTVSLVSALCYYRLRPFEDKASPTPFGVAQWSSGRPLQHTYWIYRPYFFKKQKFVREVGWGGVGQNLLESGIAFIR